MTPAPTSAPTPGPTPGPDLGPTPALPPDAPPAVILAGGLARRMGGGDKGLLGLGAGTLLSAVLGRLAEQAAPVALNANGDPARFAALRLPVLPDPVEGNPGPLAGILAAIDWAGGLGAAAVLTVPGDTPFLPRDLAARLLAARRAGGAPAVAASGGRTHPVVGLWPTALAPLLRAGLASGLRRAGDFAQAQGAVAVAFSPEPGGPDPFLNINTPADLDRARRWLR